MIHLLRDSEELGTLAQEISRLGPADHVAIDTETGQPVGLSAEALNKQRGTVITADLDIKNGFNEVVNPRPLG